MWRATGDGQVIAMRNRPMGVPESQRRAWDGIDNVGLRSNCERTDGPVSVSVDERGIVVGRPDDEILDVLFDGRRIWSFRGTKDAERIDGPGGSPWPRDLRGFLDGAALVTVGTRPAPCWPRRSSGSATARAGSGRRPAGPPLGSTPAGASSARSTPATRPGAPAARRGRDGAGRSRRGCRTRSRRTAPCSARCATATLIGHDNDADVGYLSRHTHPVDVIRESFRLQRAAAPRRVEITRYSGGAFKVEVPRPTAPAAGSTCSRGSSSRGTCVLMGEVFAPFDATWLLPAGHRRARGPHAPAPAEPDHLLAAMYGPSWRVPDPTFKFETAERDPAPARRVVPRHPRQPQRLGPALLAVPAPRPRPRPHQLARMLHRGEPVEAPWSTSAAAAARTPAGWRGRAPVLGLDYSATPSPTWRPRPTRRAAA